VPHDSNEGFATGCGHIIGSWLSVYPSLRWDPADGLLPGIRGVLFHSRAAAEGVYVLGFSFPVVPKGEARIRVQLSAAHGPRPIDQAIVAFSKVGQQYEVLGKRRKQIIERYGL
jgi:hypothetical protein